MKKNSRPSIIHGDPTPLNPSKPVYTFDYYNPKQKYIIKEIDLRMFLNPNNIPQPRYSFQQRNCIDFYGLHINNIKAFESNCTIDPQSLRYPFTYFNEEICSMIPATKDKYENKEHIKFIFFQQGNKFSHVIKRCWHTLYRNSEGIITTHDEVEQFIRNNYNEYGNMKILSDTPGGFKPIEFNIVFLPGINLIVTELLMPFFGNPLSLHVGKLTPIQLCEVFIKIINGLKNLEEFKIIHNKINANNILVDSIEKNPEIKFIDYGFSIDGNSNFILNRNDSVYYAPEVLNSRSISPERKSILYDPWKSQIYALGVVFLHLTRCLPNQTTFMEFDTFKKSAESYKNFFFQYQNYINSLDNQDEWNLMKLVGNFLAYDPQYRLSLNDIIELIPLLHNTNNNIFDNAIESRIQNSFHQNVKTNQNIDKIRALQIENMQLQNKIQLQAYSINSQASYQKKREEDMAQIFYELSNGKEQLQTICNNIISLEEKIQFKDIKELARYVLILFRKIDENVSRLHQKGKYEKEAISGERIFKILEQMNLNINAQESYIKNLSLKFTDIKDKISKEKIINVTDVYSYPDLSEKLYGIITKNKNNSDTSSNNTVENLLIGKNTFYSGSVISKNIPHGLGFIHYEESKVRFIGEFVNGKVKNDLGFAISSDDTYYFGHIDKGISLSPVLVYRNFNQFQGQDYYIGKIKDYKMEGNGKLVKPNGESFEGEFRDNKKEGTGKYIYLNGDIYEGEISSDKRKGKGKCTRKNGEYYEGQWYEDRPHGEGKYEWSPKLYYQGEVQNNQYHGKGKRYYSGYYYDGAFENGLKEGHGKIIYGENGNYSGKYFEGDFYVGGKKGKGKLVEADGSYFVGLYENDEKNGDGKYYNFKNGQIIEILEGKWINNKMEGLFTRTRPSQPSVRVRYKDDNLTSD